MIAVDTNILVASKPRSTWAQFVHSLPIIYPTVDLLQQSLDLSAAHSLSHWDSLLLAACNEAGIRTLYSEDLSHNAIYGSVRVVNPF